jgi:hypothetical protein
MPARWERELKRLREAPVPLEGMRSRARQAPRSGVGRESSGEKLVAGIVAVVVFVLGAAFAWLAFGAIGDRRTEAVGQPPPEPPGAFSLWLSAERVPLGAELVAVLVAHEDVEAIFGVFVEVDRWDGHGWSPQGHIVMCMDHWHCTARVEEPEGSVGVPGIGLGARPGSPGPVERFTTDGLEPGWYRISQTANEGIVATGVFQVANGATAPAPLVDVDAPAISISPVVVAPTGEEITLYPLIPPPASGSQSREDILRATQGLSETARIERWDGSMWNGVTTVDVRPAPGDLQTSATLPQLDPGAYRLVREGPEGPHIGPFWVDGSL